MQNALFRRKDVLCQSYVCEKVSAMKLQRLQCSLHVNHPIQVNQRYLLCAPHVFTNVLNFDISIIKCRSVQPFLHRLTFQRFRSKSLHSITLITTFISVFFYVFSYSIPFKMVLISIPEFPVEMVCTKCISLEVLIEISKL